MSTLRPDASQDDPGHQPSFEELTARLEQVVEQLERGEQSLDEALASYEQGIELIRQCNQLLDNAELRISQITTAIVERGLSEQDGQSGGRSLFAFDEDDFSEDA